MSESKPNPTGVRLVPGHLRDLSGRVRAEIESLEPVAPSLWPRRIIHMLVTGGGSLAILFAPQAGVQWFLVAASVLAVLTGDDWARERGLES